MGSYPLDRSPYGLLDVVGLCRETTSTLDAWGRSVQRGGSWQAHAEQCRIGRITATDLDEAYTTYGMRLAHDVTDEPG
ncbi:MAG: hypothetical protein RMK74_02375 [Myxococcales bacterium]|nr:hypothetical protein [Myxococcales bacterium]